MRSVLPDLVVFQATRWIGVKYSSNTAVLAAVGMGSLCFGGLERLSVRITKRFGRVRQRRQWPANRILVTAHFVQSSNLMMEVQVEGLTC